MADETEPTPELDPVEECCALLDDGKVNPALLAAALRKLAGKGTKAKK